MKIVLTPRGKNVRANASELKHRFHQIFDMKSFILFLIAFSPFAIERKPGSPLEHLPNNIEVLTHVGERADFSPDNQRIAFMSKSFGDALLIDLKTRNIQ